MSTRLAPIGPAMWDSNRRVMARRLAWPPGVLETCERLSAQHQGWWVTWRLANDIRHFEHPAAYVAYRGGPGGDVVVCAKTPAKLKAKMAKAPAVEQRWAYRGMCCDPRKPVTWRPKP